MTFVASLCDKVMSVSNSSWRDRYYATSIDQVQAVYLELEVPRHRIIPSTAQVLSAATLISPTCSYEETPAPNIQDEDLSPISSASTASTSGYFNEPSSSVHSNTSTQSSSLENSPTEPLSSSSNSSPVLPLPAVATLYCPTCYQAFKGVYGISNRQRHIRSTHLRRTKYVCAELGCGIEYSRTDNLRKHQRAVHGLPWRTDRRHTPRSGRRKTS